MKFHFPRKTQAKPVTRTIFEVVKDGDNYQAQNEKRADQKVFNRTAKMLKRIGVYGESNGPWVKYDRYYIAVNHASDLLIHEMVTEGQLIVDDRMYVTVIQRQHAAKSTVLLPKSRLRLNRDVFRAKLLEALNQSEIEAYHKSPAYAARSQH